MFAFLVKLTTTKKVSLGKVKNTKRKKLLFLVLDGWVSAENNVSLFFLLLFSPADMSIYALFVKHKLKKSFKWGVGDCPPLTNFVFFLFPIAYPP